MSGEPDSRLFETRTAICTGVGVSHIRETPLSLQYGPDYLASVHKLEPPHTCQTHVGGWQSTPHTCPTHYVWPDIETAALGDGGVYTIHMCASHCSAHKHATVLLTANEEITYRAQV